MWSLGVIADEVPETAEAPLGGDFTLVSSRGPVSLQDFRGKVVMLFFGYTKCPDVCPTSLAYMSAALNELDEAKLRGVQPMFVSVDPQRDTPKQLEEYLDYFHPAYLGLTGTEEEIAEVSKLYGAKYYQVQLEGSAFGYAVNHSAAVYLIDQDGTLRFVFPHQTPSSVMLEAMRYLLAGN
ncbi:MAG: SCO family protein [Pseudomonadota bacterium]|nr:SCO family protein [Pseudomonadota bacterium]